MSSAGGCCCGCCCWAGRATEREEEGEKTGAAERSVGSSFGSRILCGAKGVAEVPWEYIGTPLMEVMILVGVGCFGWLGFG